MAAAVASLEVGTQAVAAMMAAGTIGASCQTDVLAGEPRRVVASMRAGCSSFIDARRRASKQVRVALAMVFLGGTRDRYLTQPPLAVSAGLGQIRRQKVDSPVGVAGSMVKQSTGISYCLVRHCQCSRPTSELKLNLENNHALVRIRPQLFTFSGEGKTSLGILTEKAS